MDGINRAGRPVIIGAGLAGLMTALDLAPMPVVVLSRTALGSGIASAFAQGGIAAAIGDDDTPALHAEDTLAAGDGLSDRAVVERITAAAPAAVEELVRRGVAFDRDGDGRLMLGLEAAHRRRRIVHAGGDRSGAEIMRALVDAVRRTPSITVLEGVEARRLVTRDGRVAGVLAAGAAGPLMLASDRVVIATGGIGGLYRHTTNPLGAIGQGVALAARAGALFADMEFVQFHPTALDVGLDPMPLVSEAVRGEGAVLIDEHGERFTDELQPRDMVARDAWRHLGQGHRVFLDARQALGARFATRFPAIAAHCLAGGIDPARTPIPVRPAAHYHMGGIAVDAAGRSSVAGLWACGEVAATGLHGANRLASNSLLEAVVSARWVADSVAGVEPHLLSPPPCPTLPPRAAAGRVRSILSGALGVARERAGLTRAIAALAPLAFGPRPSADPAAVGLVIATAALAREESCGAHWRSDFPHRSARPAQRSTLRLDHAATLARRADAGAPAIIGG
jgi:L-aspartate oxidase